MKKVFLFLALLPMMAFSQTDAKTIMVVTDPHVFAPSLYDEGEAFTTMMNGQRKMIDLSSEIWEALLDTALSRKPDLLLIPGDLTKDGEIASHDLVREGLLRLKNAGINSLVIPGNHDIGGKAYSYFGEMKTEVAVLSNDAWESKYDWVYQQAKAKDTDSHSFVAEPFSGVTVIGIDGSHDKAGTGSLSDATLNWILSQADKARKKKNIVLAMSHWQLVDHFDMQSKAEPACRLANADAIRDSLMHHGVQILLTGHFHVNGITTFRDTTGLTNDSIIEITTGAPITFPCPFRWLTISGDRSTVGVQTQNIESLASHRTMYSYSEDWMREHTANLIPDLSLRAWNMMDQYVDEGVDMLIGKIPSSYLPYLEMYLGFTVDKFKDDIKAAMPQTDEEKISLVQDNIGEPVIELYILHSEGNEPDSEPFTQYWADELYAGIRNMINTVANRTTYLSMVGLQSTLSDMAVEKIEEPVQSLVEDKTHWNSENFSDVTDDLELSIQVKAPSGTEGVENVTDNLQPVKLIRDGQVLIQRGEKTYTAQGQEVR